MDASLKVSCLQRAVSSWVEACSMSSLSSSISLTRLAERGVLSYVAFDNANQRISCTQCKLHRDAWTLAAFLRIRFPSGKKRSLCLSLETRMSRYASLGGARRGSRRDRRTIVDQGVDKSPQSLFSACRREGCRTMRAAGTGKSDEAEGCRAAEAKEVEGCRTVGATEGEGCRAAGPTGAEMSRRS